LWPNGRHQRKARAVSPQENTLFLKRNNVKSKENRVPRSLKTIQVHAAGIHLEGVQIEASSQRFELTYIVNAGDNDPGYGGLHVETPA
jgi:hypothetical protein